jgi:uncharacterized membrane protein
MTGTSGNFSAGAEAGRTRTQVSTVPWLGVAQVGLALTGAAVAGYLTWTRLTGGTPVCIGFGGCDFVQASRFSELFGLPVALWGLGAYLVLAGLGIAGLLPGLQDALWLRTVTFGLALAGWLFSMYLTAVEAFVLQAWCVWCVASAVIISVLAAVCGIRLFRMPG